MKIGKISDDNGKPICVSVAGKDDYYGMRFMRKNTNGLNIIQFHDSRYNDDIAADGTPFGRFLFCVDLNKVRYDISTEIPFMKFGNYNFGPMFHRNLNALLNSWQL